MTIFILKIIACITMILDHIKYVMPITNNFITQYFGRISFPLFAFVLTEGYVHTKDLKKYYERLIIFAIISQIPFMMFRTFVGEWKMLSIMVTLLLGLISITIYDKCENKFLGFIGAIIPIVLGKILNVDYGAFGVAVIFIMYLFKDNEILLVFSYLIVLAMHFYIRGKLNFLSSNILTFIFYCVPLVFILLYNGKQGKKLKYFYYWFYPVHMLLFSIIGYYLA
jgi:hypothetical protein